jgi:hypothetical protein
MTAKSVVFFVFSCRYFDTDWRVALFDALLDQADYYHIRLGRFSVVTDPKTGDVKIFHLSKLLSLVRYIGAKNHRGSEPVYFVSTACAVPFLVVVLRLLLAPGTWLFDAYDDFSLYFTNHLRGHIVNQIFGRMMTATIIAAPNLREKFPDAYSLEIASNICADDRDLRYSKAILITSNLDGRMDYEFVKELALSRPTREIHIYGRINNRARDWPTLETLLAEAPNVRYNGEFLNGDLQKIVSWYFVALAPFKANMPVTKSTDPARFYDYLNGGLEIISTDIPRARDRSDFIHVARSSAEAAEIWTSLESNPLLRKGTRWKPAEHSWFYRSRQLSQILREIESKKR